VPSWRRFLVFVVPIDEELEVAQQAAALVAAMS
jgi:hypothetical protein